MQELQEFPSNESLSISVELVHRLSPDSLSVMEFKNEIDIDIAEKMAKFPTLGEEIDGKWKLKLSQEIHMTNYSYLFKTELSKGLIPLIQGNMFHQFKPEFVKPKYWINLQEGRAKVLGRTKDMDCKPYRIIL